MQSPELFILDLITLRLLGQIIFSMNFFENFLGQGPFCRATDCPYFGLHVTFPMGFKARVVLLHACLCTVNLQVMSGATPPFSTNMGVHCISVYISGSPSRHPSWKQQREGNSGLLTWAAVKFDLMLPAQQANVGHWATLTGSSMKKKLMKILFFVMNCCPVQLSHLTIVCKITGIT